MGDAVNLAARLMAKAGPSVIYSTADVLDRSNTRFATTELEPFMVKGKAHPVRAWSVGEAIGSRGRERELERFPLFGREEELAALTAALDIVRGGEARLVEVVGEPGIGKTRLLEELRERAQDLRVLHATCEAYTASTPYSVWRELLREVLGVGWETPDDEVAARLYAEVAEHDPEGLPWLPLVAMTLDVEMAPTLEVEMLDEQFRRTKLHEVVARFLEMVLHDPVLIQIEDAHHMDEASAELLRAIAEQLPARPWLFCVTSRPDGRGFEPPVGPAITRLEPAPLAEEDALLLAEAATEDRPIQPHLLRAVAHRSGGNPQFLRDLIRTAVATGGAGGLPDSVEAAAMARIDALAPDDRAAVRRAAVLGVSFHPRMLGWVLDEAIPVDSVLARVAEFFEDDGGGYLRFRRGLLRDAAYEGLPYRLRRELHCSVGQRLEEEVGEDVADLAAALSLHFFLGGRYGRAWRYGRIAGDRARDRYAPAEAVTFYRRALDSARRSTTPMPRDEVAEITEALGEVLIRAGEFERAVHALDEARRLRSGDAVSTARLVLREAYVAERVGRADLVVRRSRRAIQLLADLRTPDAAALRAQAEVSLAWARQHQGRPGEALRLAEEAIPDAERSGNRHALAEAYLVHDWALFDLGRADEATLGRRALEIFESLGDLHAVATASNTLGAFAYFRGQWDEAITLYERMSSSKEQLGDPVHAVNGTLNVAEVLSDQGRWEEAEERLRRVLRVWRGAGEETGVAFATAYMGRVASRVGRAEEAIALLTEARDAFAREGAHREAALAGSWLAEWALLEGRWTDAAREAEDMLASEGASRPLLERIRGYALARLGLPGAREALDKSLRLADEEASDFERALTLKAFADLSPGDPAAAEARATSEALLARLGVVRVAEPREPPPASA
jgi:tetratricopeptide (TPR) repeat protein